MQNRLIKKKKQAKSEKQLEKKNKPKSGDLSDTMAYVDEFDNMTSEPPVKKAKPEGKKQAGEAPNN